jgi:hypothetical protein
MHHLLCPFLGTVSVTLLLCMAAAPHLQEQVHAKVVEG